MGEKCEKSYCYIKYILTNHKNMHFPLKNRIKKNKQVKACDHCRLTLPKPQCPLMMMSVQCCLIDKSLWTGFCEWRQPASLNNDVSEAGYSEQRCWWSLMMMPARLVTVSRGAGCLK